MGVPTLPVGERIRYWREKKQRKQAAVAGLCGITEEYLSQIERGLKTPSLAVLLALANELGVRVSALLGEEKTESPAESGGVAQSVARALMGYGPKGGAGRVAANVLSERVETAWRMWQTSTRQLTDKINLSSASFNDLTYVLA
ncbi:helix-turn-helix transcriptional regulator [Sphaerisporangium sp. NPDC051011]|uniref:helix-turn-helix domain-containing protein n=1 Tax=Sphaerisporangium sp. NPDC051011 TaxID=3155792 RepID=UPI0033E77EB3